MGDQPEAGRQLDPRIAVLDDICNVEETAKPFGKRWHQEEVILTDEHLRALREGKVVAVDVREEYVVFLRLHPGVAAMLKEQSHGM